MTINYRKILKKTLKVMASVVSFIVLYLAAAWALSYVSVNNDFKSCQKDAVEIYIMTNGVHTDLVVPVANDMQNWTTIANPADTKSKITDVKYIGFGWGDKGFYLETPTWDELKFSTAFKAMFFMSTTAMHVTFHKTITEDESCKKICISKDHYTKLVNYIKNSFVTKDQTPLLIQGASYWDNDLFYDAKGTYSLFTTCNTWANSGLKAADLKACLWTPFDWGIFKQYEE